MEVALNVLWLLLGVAAFGFWLCRNRRGLRMPVLLRELPALACLVILLFPVLSMTDDLHFHEFAMEDAAGTYKKALSPTDFHKSSLHVSHLQAVVLVAAANPPQETLGLVSAEPIPSLQSLPAPYTRGRAPPFFS